LFEITGGPAATEKCAVTLRFASITTLAGLFVPVTSPLQLLNCDPGAGTAVSVTRSSQ
jgi:hypothetical protein